jgi:oligopeptide/dipeptide ABC transporter ATP-binding protein
VQSATPVLAVEDLQTVLTIDGRQRLLVDGVSFQIGPAETLGLIGESGSGKTMTALSIMRLLAQPISIAGGSVCYQGTDLVPLSQSAMGELRGNRLAMIFQNPRERFDPMLTISRQLVEVILRHRVCESRRAAYARAEQLLDEVHVASPRRVMHMYPNELSGGMLQRAMIAIAIASSPNLLIADEPTSSLDVTVQAEVLDLLLDLQRAHRMSMLFITHDIAVAREMAHDIAVMYAGQIVETGAASEVLRAPRHPYTRALIKAVPRHLVQDAAVSQGGAAPGPAQLAPEASTMATAFRVVGRAGGCRFAPKCPEAGKHGKADIAPPLLVDEKGSVRCWLYEEQMALQ